jgi:mannosyl-oligosaccharide glucosidase
MPREIFLIGGTLIHNLVYHTFNNRCSFRGPIWININYLALSALYHYGTLEGPYREYAQSLYQQLRYNVVKNVLRVFHETGDCWEHYDDKTGDGMRGHPFTGWTAVIVNIMAERY